MTEGAHEWKRRALEVENELRITKDRLEAWRARAEAFGVGMLRQPSDLWVVRVVFDELSLGTSAYRALDPVAVVLAPSQEAAGKLAVTHLYLWDPPPEGATWRLSAVRVPWTEVGIIQVAF